MHLSLHDVLSSLFPDVGKDWGQEEKGTTEDEMAGWHHRLGGHGFGWTPGVGEGQGGLACWGSWDHRESDTTERLNWTELIEFVSPSSNRSPSCVRTGWYYYTLTEKFTEKINWTVALVSVPWEFTKFPSGQINEQVHEQDLSNPRLAELEHLVWPHCEPGTVWQKYVHQPNMFQRPGSWRLSSSSQT